MRGAGVPIRSIDLSGGQTKSDLLVQLYADATGCDLSLPACPEPVLLGAACAAAAADPAFESFRTRASANPGRLVKPDNRRATILNGRYSVFSSHYPALPSKPKRVAKAL